MVVHDDVAASATCRRQRSFARGCATCGGGHFQRTISSYSSADSSSGVGCIAQMQPSSSVQPVAAVAAHGMHAPAGCAFSHRHAVVSFWRFACMREGYSSTDEFSKFHNSAWTTHQPWA